jgi:hypothetical protein
MKSFTRRIIEFIKYLKGFRKNRKFELINEKLTKKVEDNEVDKIILKGEIIRMVRKYLNINAKSKYIPKTHRNNTEIRERVLAEFGDRMKNLNIGLNSKLELV